MKNLGIKITIGVSAILFIIGISMYFNITNTEMTKRKDVLAQQEVVEAYYDKSFKIIAQQAEIADHNMDKSKEAFKEIYVAMMEERYSEGEGMMMKWVQESNPQFDLNATSELYKTLMHTVEAQREGFFMENKKLISMNADYEKYCERRPFNALFIGEYEKIEIIVVTSSTTKEVYETGEENEIKLFE